MSSGLMISLTVSQAATNLIVCISLSGDCSTIWPANATPEQIADRSLPRVEIFKMPGGTEYIIHDIDKSNHIIGKARFSGHLKVSESMSVDGFGGHDILDDVGPGAEESKAPPGNEPLNEGSESTHHFMNLVKQPSPSRPQSRRPGKLV
jgi:hypothetical protein